MTTPTRTILVIEDDAAVMHGVLRILERAGYTVLTATNGEEGLAMFSKHEPKIDFVLTDVLMPKKDGAAVAREIRARSSVPILVMTGDSGGLDLSNFPVIAKPFRNKDLVERVASLRT